MKKFLTGILSLCLFCEILHAAPIIIRDAVLPGATETSSWYLPDNFTAAAPESGTLSLWLNPADWSEQDKNLYSIVKLGSRDIAAPGVEFNRQPNGNLQVLWFRDLQTQRGQIIVRSPCIAAGQWIHLALTWQSNGKSTITKLWLNGKPAGSHWLNFVWGGNDRPRIWQINTPPAWAAPKSGKAALGKSMLFPRVLTASEIESLVLEKFFTGNRAYVDRNFLPDTENSLTGELMSAAAGAVADIEYIDENGQVQKRTVPLNIRKDNTFSLPISTLSDTHEVAFTVRERSGKFPPWRIRKIDRDSGMPKLKPNYWQASWLLPDLPPGTPPRKGGYVYYVKEFDLDLSQVAKAACQYIGSNNGTAYINGVDLGRTYGWATPKAVDDVLPLLRNGKNVFAGDAYIPNNSATFMGELTLIMKDGSVRYIASDTSWGYSETLQPGWGKPEFDHSAWPRAISNTRPPQLPYGATRYRNYAPVPEVKFAGVPRNWQGTAGSTVVFELAAPGVKLHPEAEIWLQLMKKDREFYRMPMHISYADGKLYLRGVLNIPDSALNSTYAVNLVSRDLTVPVAPGTLTVTGSTRVLPPLTAELKKINGTPTLHINGKPETMMSQRGAENVRNDTTSYRFTSGLDQAGVRLLELNLNFSRLWNPDDSVNTDELDLYLQSALFYAPDSYLIVILNTDAPEWYLKKFPGERYVSNRGAINKISYASRQYHRDAAAFLARLIGYLQKRSYYNRIAGIGMDGGDDGQFMQWAGPGRKYVGDYSVPMQNYFHDCLQKKYGDIANLNAQWHTSYPDFAAIAIPEVKRRQGSAIQVFLDPAKDQDIIEFNRAFSSCVADFITDLAAVIKKSTGRTRLVSAYYGKFFSIAGILQWGEFDIERILKSPDFDYLIAVDYIERPVGHPHELAAPAASYRMHNKIFVDEADIRTYIAGASRWAKTETLYEFTAQARKMFLKSWVNGMGMHWYDIHGGMFENKGLHKTIANIRKIAGVDPSRQTVPAEIALIADEKSFIYTTFGSRRRFNVRQNSAFGYLGAPYDVWFLNDLGKPGFPEYKMYVFLNVIAPAPEYRRAIDALKRDGKLLVFLHNSGYIDGKTRNAVNTERLTGIKMRESGQISLAMRLVPNGKQPLFQRIGKVIYASSGNTDSALVPDDPNAEYFGEFVKDPRFKPMAYKRFGTWSSFYCSLGIMPLDLYRELARAAGVHFYIDNDPDAIVYIGSDLLGIHSAYGGVKKLNFPKAHTFIDAFTGKTAAENTRTPELSLRPGETRIFRIK